MMETLNTPQELIMALMVSNHDNKDILSRVALQINLLTEQFAQKLSQHYKDGWTGPEYYVDESGHGYYKMILSSKRKDIPDYYIAGHKLGVVLAQAICCIEEKVYGESLFWYLFTECKNGWTKLPSDSNNNETTSQEEGSTDEFQC